MQPQNLSLVYLSSQRLHDRRTKRVTLFDRTGIGLRRIQLSLHQLTIRFPVEARAKRFNILYRLNALAILKISYSELQGEINSLMISEQLSLMIKVSKKI